MFITSIEVIKDFVNDPDVIKFKINDQSRLIDVRNHNEKIGENKGIAKKIQAFSKSNNAIALNLSKKK